MVKFICVTFLAPSLQIPIKSITICYRYATASIMWLVPILEAIRETTNAKRADAVFPSICPSPREFYWIMSPGFVSPNEI